MMRQWIRVAKQEQVTGQKFVKVAPALDALDSVSQFMRVHNLGFVLPRFFWPCMPRFFGDVKLVEGSNGNSPKTIAAAMSMLKYGARYQEVLSSPIVIHTLKFCNLSHRALAKATHESESLFLKLSHEIIDSMQSLVDGSSKLKSDLQQAVIRDFYLSSGATPGQNLHAAGVYDQADKLTEFAASVCVFRSLVDVCVETCSFDALLYISRYEQDTMFERVREIERELRMPSLQTTDLSRLRIELLRIIYPRAFAELRAQWEDKTPKKVICLVAEAHWTATENAPAKRNEKEDLKLVRREFPNLYHLATHPGPEEIARIKERRSSAKLLKQLVRRLDQEGIPRSFYLTQINSGARDFDKIVKRYKAAGNGTVPQPREQKQSGRNGFASKEQFLESISFSPATESHIRAAGLTRRDVVFGICKGFDFGKGNGGGAVGFSHYQGPKIRASLAFHCSVSPGDFLTYLESVDLLRRFGSGSKGRAKDDAMSIKTDPSSEVGRDILSTLNASFAAIRRQERSA